MPRRGSAGQWIASAARHARSRHLAHARREPDAREHNGFYSRGPTA